MKQIVKYDVIQADSIDQLIQKVNDFIAIGWTPHGGICEGGDNDNFKFFQAIVQLM